MLNRAERRAIKYGRAFSQSRYVYQAYHQDMDELDFKGDYSGGAGVAGEISRAGMEEAGNRRALSRAIRRALTREEWEALCRRRDKGGMNHDRALDHFENLA